MSYPEYLLRIEAGAVRLLLDVGTASLAAATPESVAIPLAQLREAGRV